MPIQTVNPATGEIVEKFDPTTPAELERIEAGAQAAFQDWRGVPFAERAPRMQEAARVLRARKRFAHDGRDGQAHHSGGGRGREVRVDL
jgi:acyl-CoA reductase-like NAD-dependent aldehyde dehydrogenase